MIIDESDADLDVFPRARALGYAGVSSKTCKGLYKSMINAARCLRWNAEGPRYFMSAEDLTLQAGIAVHEYPPATVKKSVCGTGNATKLQVQFMVTQRLRLKKAPEPADAADGVAAALAHLMGVHLERVAQAGRR